MFPNIKIKDLSTDIDFSDIISQYQISLIETFPDMQKWENKGEFETIGISYYLKEIGHLKYLIIDDKRPYTFV